MKYYFEGLIGLAGLCLLVIILFQLWDRYGWILTDDDYTFGCPRYHHPMDERRKARVAARRKRQQQQRKK